MTTSTKQDFPQFVAIKRIMKLPVVSSGVDKATCIYVRVKMSNRVIQYGFENAESTVWTVVDMSVPLVTKFEDPINKIDEMICKSLDVVEQNVPFVTYTPEEMYYTTKTYVRDKVVPVLKRADSVKQLAMLDDALSVADKYVDKYLPDKDPVEDLTDKPNQEPSSQAVKTIRHVNRFSRKLQRRLTRRTIAEAKLLKKQGYDTVNCLVYFADLLAKDPNAFAQKIKVIWQYLSEDEPENQKPPENIEQLLEMLTRESARRFVHASNFVVNSIYMTPTYSKRAFHFIGQEASYLVDKILEYAHLEDVKVTVEDIAKFQIAKTKKNIEGMWKLILEYLLTLRDTLKNSKNKSCQNKENDVNTSKEYRLKKKSQKLNGEKKPAEQTSSSSSMVDTTS